MRNDSSLAKIESIKWAFASPIFIDSAGGGSGFGSALNYVVSGAQTYSSSFNITVGANSDVLTGYTGPTSFTDGANQLTLTFNSFDPGESFAFWTDLDTSNNNSGRVGNSDFNGTVTTIKFSDGYEKVYTWQLPNNDGRTSEAFQVGGTPTTSTVPEPATMMLLGGGLAGIAAKRFRRKNV